MNSIRRTGIIDIGSNSVRVVICEITASSAYRVIHEFKESARLSQRIGPDGTLSEQDAYGLVRILRQFKRICEACGASDIRAVATAAIRNAANASQIMDILQRESGISVELLSGTDEARLGFVGVIQTMDVADGILVDIGGGSTEVSVFRNRRLQRSVSFPFGAVNTAAKFGTGGDFSQASLQSIRAMAERAIDEEPWIRAQPGLPLIGLGGTMRNLGKINQRRHKYPLSITHNYAMSASDLDELASWIPGIPAEKRKKIDGLSKDRFDIIVPGLAILQTIFRAAGASHYIVSGAGLRDGLLFEHMLPQGEPQAPLPVRSARHLLELHPAVPREHAEQVSRFAGILFDELQPKIGLAPRYRQILQAAALLYRIGVTVNYYHFAKHSFYLIAHSRLDGLTHRETMLCALIASYKNKKRTLQQSAIYKSLLHESDIDLVARLGCLLQLAVALDYSLAQPLAEISTSLHGKTWTLRLHAKKAPDLEVRQAEGLRKDFEKLWNLALVVRTASESSDVSISRS